MKRDGTIVLGAFALMVIFLAYVGNALQQSNDLLAGAATSHIGPAEVYPDAAKTPGALNPAVTQATINSTICVKGWTATPGLRPTSSYTTALKKKQLAAGYNYHGDLSPASYEEDHFVSLELGGNPTDPKNLWPEPYNLPTGGAKAKDAVENYLKAQVCKGSLTLQEAQGAIMGDWYAVYIKITNSAHVGGLEVQDPDDEQ